MSPLPPPSPAAPAPVLTQHLSSEATFTFTGFFFYGQTLPWICVCVCVFTPFLCLSGCPPGRGVVQGPGLEGGADVDLTLPPLGPQPEACPLGLLCIALGSFSAYLADVWRGCPRHRNPEARASPITQTPLIFPLGHPTPRGECCFDGTQLVSKFFLKLYPLNEI